MWQQHTQRWAVRHWTASWQSGRSVSAQGRVCRNQEEALTSRREDSKMERTDLCSQHLDLPKWKHKLLVDTFAYQWQFTLNRVLCGFWIWSIRESSYWHFWTETLQLLSKSVFFYWKYIWLIQMALEITRQFSPDLIHVGLFAVHQLVWFVLLMTPDSSTACA